MKFHFIAALWKCDWSGSVTN